MGKHRRLSEDDRRRYWWEKTFHEREVLLRERFGETDPPGHVISFSWRDLIVPGACALCFPPKIPERTHWLYLSHGLTQPLKPEPPVRERWSGYGCEFAILTKEKSPWATDALYKLITYWKLAEATIGLGHRVPMAFFDDRSDDMIRPELGMVQQDDPVSPLGEMRALLFWTYMIQPKPLWTSTGYFDILVGTAITEREWEMAKETSSTHILYLLSQTGIGQVSELRRTTLTHDPRWSAEWKTIRQLSEEKVQVFLNPGIQRPVEPPMS